jgi:hypothetical protein
MSFIRDQEIRLAVRLLRGQYVKEGLPVPVDSQLEAQAARVVDEAHAIAKARGRNILGILKEVITQLFSQNKKE